MFKKNDLVQVKLETIVRFFDSVAEQKDFQFNEVNQTWLWGKLQFLVDFFKHNNLESISQEKLHELIYLENHKIYFQDYNHEVTKNNAIELDLLVQQEPLLQSLSNNLFSSWVTYFEYYLNDKKDDKFSKKHLFSILNISLVSFLIVAAFYSWKVFGTIGAFSILGIFVYQAFKKLLLKLSNFKKQKTIKNEVQKTLTTNTVRNMDFFENLGLEPWTNDRDVNDALRQLKNKTIYFLSIYNKKKENQQVAMLLDVERMWKQHIPLFIEKTAENSSHKDIIINTLHSMENVIQKHIEELFWDDGIEISAKQKFWLAKETQKNI
jgi:hypothetical protein